MKTKSTSIAVFLIILLLNCTTRNDAYYFNNDVTIYDSDTIPSYSVTGNIVNLDDIYAGYISVYDSIIFFISNSYPDYLVYSFNLNSTKLLGKFFKKGNGPGEFLRLTHQQQYDINGSDIRIWGRDFLSKNIDLFNITKSVAQETTVIDSTLTLDWKKYGDTFAKLFILDNDEKLANFYNEAGEQNKMLPNFILYNAKEEEIKEYKLYNNPLRTESGFTYSNYYQSVDRIKPDRTKIAMAMRAIGQINIIDIPTGKIISSRLKSSPDFDYLTTNDINKLRIYYIGAGADDNYIYGLYSDTPAFSHGEFIYPFLGKTVNVFDWEGKFVAKIVLDHHTEDIAFDPVRKKLYCMDIEDNLYSYDFSFLYERKK
jgi:hypothetical protein